MEGGVDGVVAVVSWFSEAGLALDLLKSSRQCRAPEKLTAPRPCRNPSNAIASQTVSEHNFKRRRLSPEPYASTYQVAHCGVDTRSAACEHTEFPPQRQKPSSGYQYRPQKDRDVDAFVTSLRKYPSMTEHLPSTQLLEQLLKTTLIHSPKQSQTALPSKKRRHHWDKPRIFTSLNPYAHKQKESYRRSRKKKHTSTHVDSKEPKYSLQRGLVSVTAFDYLKSGAQSSAEHLPKRIDDTIIKNVFREKNLNVRKPVTTFPVCPNLQTRFEMHLKKYHATTSKTPHVDLESLPTCNKCLKTRPCPCDAAKRARRIVDKDVQEIRQLEDAIFSWLKDIPVFPNENPQDKLIRDDIVKKLAETLSKFNDADFTIKGEEEIRRALDKMPMWYPRGEEERENFKNDIINNLLEKIKSVQEMKMFNQATRDFFDNIKFGKEIDAEQALDDMIKELNKIALNRPESNDVYRDLLKMKAFEVLDRLEIRSKGNKYEYLNKFSNELADRLSNVSKEAEHKRNLDKGIKNILDDSNIRIKDRVNVEEKVQAVMADLAAQKIDKHEADRLIKSVLHGKVPDSEIENIAKKTLASAEISEVDPKIIAKDINDIRDILDRSNVQIKDRANVEKDLSQLVSDIATKGIEENKAKSLIQSILKGKVPEDKLKEITEQVLSSATRLHETYSPLSEETLKADCMRNRDKVEEHIRDIVSVLVTRGLDKSKAQDYINSTLKGKVPDCQLEHISKKVFAMAENASRSYSEHSGYPVASSTQNEEKILFDQVFEVIRDWLKNLNIRLSNKKLNEVAEAIANETLDRRKYLQLNPGVKISEAKESEILKEQIYKVLNNEVDKKLVQSIMTQTDDLMNSLKQILGKEYSQDSHITKTSFMSSTNDLNDIVKDWCDALPLSDTCGAFRIKQDLANRIILKVSEMNMNQDIFNDDLLYDEILQDFIDQQVNELLMETHITDVSIKQLTNQIKQIKQKVHEDFIGRKYKQQLRDTISNVLPSIACPTAEDLASFELMKENLADAFINLNYSVECDTARAKFKRRIMDEINKYSNDYLKRCPATPVNTRKLNEDLYNALKNVPVPGDESMRTEVESVRMKDVINDWLKTLPMSRQSMSEQLHTNKVVTLMAQKLQELENEFHPNFEDIAVATIATYLKKLPLHKKNLREMAKKLVDKIKNSAESRAFVEGMRSKLTDDCLCEASASFIPPSGLSKEDQEKMQRIRERAVLCEACTQSRRCRDAAVNPPPLNHESQTDMPCNNNKSCQHAEKPKQVCSKSAIQTKRMPITTRPCPSTEGQADCSPCVIVKEYYLDLNSGNKVETASQTPVEESGRICIPSSLLNTGRLCRHQSSLSSRRVPVKPRTRPEASYQAPRRQCTSACPNEYLNHPKHCPRSSPVPDYLRSSCRRFGPSCGRMKSPCLSCKRNPTTICDKCFPMHMCPHPTCLYFK
ncbi:uncharacterized protein LOC134666573 [Cydia fagiglandana]|uniref:uncharacterized protein LOC134666573 n=1 Tax=Cydia fagiglandana TaxID=1458189 RepID=UPI002FEDF59C